MSEKISKEQLAEIMKSNPDFAKRVVSTNAIKDSTNPTCIFKKFAEAKAVLGLLDYEEIDIPFVAGEGEIKVPEGCYDLGSGVIHDEDSDFFASLIGKQSVSIALSDGLDIYKNCVELSFQDCGLLDISYKKAITPIRFCFVKRDDKIVDKDGKLISDEKFRTVGHVNGKDMCHVGKYLVSKTKVHLGKPGVENDKSFIEISIKCNPETGDVSFHTDWAADSTDGIYVIPLVVSTEARNQTLELVEKTWSEKENEFKEKLIEGYSEEEKSSIREYLNTSGVLDTKGFNKGLAVFAINNNTIHRIENAIEDNTKKIDALNVSAALFPRFGEEYIDIKKKNIVLDEKTKLPVITETDINNLKVVGLKPQFISSIIQGALGSYKAAEGVIENFSEDQRKETAANAYDAECRLIVDLDSDKWFESVDKELADINALRELDLSVETSKKHIETIVQELASFQLTSRRIAAKIEGGEFSNLYMQICNNYFNGLYAKVIGLKPEEVKENNVTPFVEFLSINNNRSKEGSDFAKNKIIAAIGNTLTCNFKRDKFGNVPANLFDLAADLVYGLFDKKVIPANLTEEQANERIMDIVFTRLGYIDSLSRSPYKYLGRIIPSVFELKSDKKELAEKKAAEYRAGLGLGGTFDMSEDELLAGIGDSLTKIRAAIAKKITSDDWEDVIKKIQKNLTNYNETLNNTRCKGNLDKARLFARVFVLLNATEYVDTLASDLARFTGTLEEARTEEATGRRFIVHSEEPNAEDCTLNEIKEEADLAKHHRVLLKKINDDEKTDIAMDWLLRSALFAKFILAYGYTSSLYVDHITTSTKERTSKTADDYNKMLISELSLFTPSITALELEDFDIKKSISNDMKIRIGTNACDDALAGFDNKEKLVAARSTYVLESIKFVAHAIDSTIGFIVAEGI